MHRGSIYHSSGQNTMGRGFDILCVGCQNTMGGGGGQNTMDRRFDIPWAGGSKYHG